MTRASAPLFVLLLLTAACVAVPGGGSHFNIMPLSTEMSLGADAYRETLTEATLIETGPDAEMVRRIGQRIAAAAKRLYPVPSELFQFEFVLIDDPETVNAWALPGGKSAVYSGLLPIAEDENGLAIVMGHEVAHAIARHGGARMSEGLAVEVLMGVTSSSLGDMTPEKREAVMSAFGAGVDVMVMLPFSRDHETEADELGLNLAAAAGYDPRASIPLWERMGANSQAGPPEFLSTHPSEETRIAHLTAIMPRALEFYRQAGGR